MPEVEKFIEATKAARLQRMDGILGPPLCAILSALNTLTPAAKAPPATQKPRSIGFFKLGEQGSTVLAIPAIEEAARRVGRENVHFVVFAENRKILDVLGLVPPENIHEVHTKSLAAFFASTLRTVKRLRALPLDAAIDLDFFARSSAILVRLSGARWRVGQHAYFGEGPYRGNLMTHRPRYNPHIHTSRLFRCLVGALDADPAAFPAWPDSDPQPALPQIDIPSESADRVKALLRSSLSCEIIPPIVLLNANCSDMIPLRRWESARFVDLARRTLAEFPEAAVIFTGAPVEEEQAAALAREVGSPRCISLAGKTALEDLFALYAESKVLVTNDSGPAHFASLTPVGIVVLFGPETPTLFGPLSPGSVALSAGLPCSPCVSAQNNRLSACRNNLCMQAIPVETVMHHVRNFLSQPTETPGPRI
jgi:ADP-heptose:LPS heptosyltransferase